MVPKQDFICNSFICLINLPSSLTYLQQQLENVKSLSFAIKNYIDWQKFVSGAS